MLIVYADGGCWPNPGPARYGLAIFDDQKLIAKFGHKIGVATNNVAEWRGCIAALDFIESSGVHAAELRMDSQLVLNQLTGKWRVKHAGLVPYADVGKRLWMRLHRSGVHVHARWVPREQNTHADEMTRIGLDTHATL